MVDTSTMREIITSELEVIYAPEWFTLTPHEQDVMIEMELNAHYQNCFSF
jgi:hypothetical protein